METVQILYGSIVLVTSCCVTAVVEKDSAINMDSADNATLQQALAAQGALLGKHDETLSQLAQQMQELTLAIQQLARPVQGEVTPPAPLPPPPAASAEVQLPAPLSAGPCSSYGPAEHPSGFPDGALYQQGLNEDLKDELATRDPPNTLEDLYEEVSGLD
ncbi:hypothetical protein NFI96_010182 [Prochilodus magdalenae]|nr:hypothetical protein NFI96_010182 [Prochilodus magdalenae]